MPTHNETERFLAEFGRLTPDQQAAFRATVAKLVHDLKLGRLRKGLRVKRVKRSAADWEITWADDGRARFRFGEPIRPGEPHIIWLRIGTHDILDAE